MAGATSRDLGYRRYFSSMRQKMSDIPVSAASCRKNTHLLSCILHQRLTLIEPFLAGIAHSHSLRLVNAIHTSSRARFNTCRMLCGSESLRELERAAMETSQAYLSRRTGLHWKLLFRFSWCCVRLHLLKDHTPIESPYFSTHHSNIFRGIPLRSHSCTFPTDDVPFMCQPPLMRANWSTFI